jgi:3-oxoacyl-[acyl-carrier-protein] synthase III
MRTDGTLREGAVFAPVVDGCPQRRWASAPGPVRLESFDPDAIKTAGRRAVELCQEACRGALAAAGLGLSDVDLYVGAQSQGWFVDACRRGLGLRADQAIDTFKEVASLGPATLPFNLLRARETGRLREGAVVLMYSPGVGLTRAALVYRHQGRAAR